jgi:2-isopropylmalate synthase
MDGRELEISGVGNGPISCLANALNKVGIELDVKDYREHAIGKDKGEGRGREVRAATFIECEIGAAEGKKQTVWGIGTHQDAAQASLIAILSAASSVSF